MPLDIVIPVYHGTDDLALCLASLKGNAPKSTRIVIVDDGTRDLGLIAMLEKVEAEGGIVVLRHKVNQGFPSAVNTGMRHAQQNGPRDVLLLNDDTMLPAKAVHRLVRAAYAEASIGSVTPMTNNGTLVSYPLRDPPAAAPDLSGLRALDRVCQAANGNDLVDIPTAVGFCMLIRHDCLAEVGCFRDDVFAQGYGEENDWCLRAGHLGWRHVAATGVYVAHTGGTTFGALKSDLIGRNLGLLNKLHPGYAALIDAFQARDPIRPARDAVDLMRWNAGRSPSGAVLLLTHDQGGGVTRHVGERCAAIRAEGGRPIVLSPVDAGDCLMSESTDEDALSVRFRLPEQFKALLKQLALEKPRHLELHHFIGFRAEMTLLAKRLSIPLDIYVHDYGLWCPRVTMVGDGDRYCGEPAQVETCIACVSRHGERLRDPITVPQLRVRSAAWLASARRVIAPSMDTATRIARQFARIAPTVLPWENAAELAAKVPPVQPRLRLRPGERVRVLVPGAIGLEKGYELLSDCAKDARTRDLALEFIIVGFTMDDSRLMETGRVFVTGRFDEDEGPDLVARQNAHLGFIPSVWPETWCYALSLLWRGGLRVAAFDLGAPAERIRQTGTGAVMPLGLPVPRVNDFLLSLVMT